MIFKLVNRIAWVLEVLMDSLFERAHWSKRTNSLLTTLTRIGYEGPDTERVVSSANKIQDKKLEIFGRSFTYNRKRRGPRIDPCGTPIFKHLQSLLDSAILTY